MADSPLCGPASLAIRPPAPASTAMATNAALACAFGSGFQAPYEAAIAGQPKPARVAGRKPAIFRRGRKPRRKTLTGERAPCRAIRHGKAPHRGAVLFGYFLFWQARESSPAAGRRTEPNTQPPKNPTLRPSHHQNATHPRWRPHANPPALLSLWLWLPGPL